MSNSDLLKGKEYLDFLLEFLQGKKDEQQPPDPKKEKQWCFHELTEEESKKLSVALEADKDIVYYFNVKDGMKVLVDSLQFNCLALDMIQKLLEGDAKMQEDFQK
jgi:hypothetical protein